MNKITSEYLESLIVNETFTVLPSGKVVVCELTLVNGFSVRGDAAVVDPANFVLSVGQAISRKRAVDAMWQLEGYLLQQRLFEAQTKQV